MKRLSIALASVLLLCLSAYALKSGAFKSIEDLSTADNLLIIEVNSLDPPIQDKDASTLDHKAQVLKDLRGRLAKGEKVSVSVQRRLSPGSRYVLAGMRTARDAKPWLLFHWDLGVVEIPSSFKLETLEGKDIPTQINMILTARRDDIKKQIQELYKERERLDAVIAKGPPTKEADVAVNTSCARCQKLVRDCMVGKCGRCGGQTMSSHDRYCFKCAKALKRCEHCGGPL